MESFEELGVSAHLAEALAAEGIETPTPLQSLAIPVIQRGNSAVLRGGPGAGVLVAYGVALLERLEPGARQPRALVITAERNRAGALAISLARLATATDHRVGALGVPWALPEHSDILFTTPGDLEHSVRSSTVKLDRVEAIVLDEASGLLERGGDERLASILLGLEAEDLQLVLAADSIDFDVRRFAERHARRAVFLPAEAASPSEGAGPASDIVRGSLRVRTLRGPEEEEVPALVSELLDEGHAHVLVFVRSEDRAADVGDMLGLRGFKAGVPGAVDVPVWLAVNALEARRAIQEGGVDGDGVVILSLDVPSDADELDRRHGRSATRGVVLAQPRELPHLRRGAREAGYSVEPPEDRRAAAAEASAAFLEEVERILDSEDLLPYLLLLEPLLQKREAAEVAAALAHQLRRTRPAPGEPSQGIPGGSDGETKVVAARPPAWVRIFLSLGERDGVGPGDVLGAILGETGIGRDQVGRIDLHDTYSRVEVHEAVASRVIGALNGTTIRGRSVRADFDRKEQRTAPGKGSTEGGGPRRGSEKPSASRGRPRGGGGREGGGRGDR